jgi:hypothetical protein
VPASSASSSIAASPGVASRPSSSAVVRIVKPKAGQTVPGPTIHVVLDLMGARIVSYTTTHVQPDEGHVHLYVDNQLVSMNYGLQEDLTLAPGTYLVRAEFVAADHAPFSPRVVSDDVLFSVN